MAVMNMTVCTRGVFLFVFAYSEEWMKQCTNRISEEKATYFIEMSALVAE